MKDTTEVQDISNKFNENFAFLSDPGLNEYEKLVMYMNQQEGNQFITDPQFMSILTESL